MRIRTVALAGVALLLGAAAPVVACSPVPGPPGVVSQSGPVLGSLTFPNSGAEAAQGDFSTGMLLLHNFEYVDAAAAFRRAEAADPGFAMAYWGEALSYYHPLWGEIDSAAAQSALARLAPTRDEREALAPTAREKAFLASVEDLFAPGNIDREGNYERALGALHADEDREWATGRQPGVEAAALHALAIIAAQHGIRDDGAYARAAEILEQAHLRNQDHPGVVHYLIHAYDAPDRAHLGVCAAERYSRLAAASPHAKHMPSHIWSALGRWADLVEANEQAWQASEQHGAHDHTGSEGRDWHSLRFAQYGHLQQRRFDNARHALDQVHADAAANPSPRLTWHALRMHAAQIVEGEDWALPPYAPPTTAGIDAAAVGGNLFATGLAAVNRGDLGAAKKAAEAMTHDPQQAAKVVGDKPHGFGTTEKSAPIVEVMRRELTGLIALAEGDRAAGLADLRAAATASDRLSVDYGPPNPVKPAHELLGETLLRLGDAPAALDAFTTALRHNPNRYLSLRGQAAAAQATGRPDIAEQAAAAMRDIEAGRTTRQCA